ncbi:hypothetical protein KC342_g18308 [Hortaea werneckii]|nr:hypothetical protein KC342_g18308 [Hortaea werneckii]KAI7372252.1 hypothetical protein KC328_g17373 [Hortaea werneckii]
MAPVVRKQPTPPPNEKNQQETFDLTQGPAVLLTGPPAPTRPNQALDEDDGPGLDLGAYAATEALKSPSGPYLSLKNVFACEEDPEWPSKPCAAAARRGPSGGGEPSPENQ